MKTLALDVDGVIADFVTALCKEILAHGGRDLNETSFATWDLAPSLLAHEIGIMELALKLPGFCTNIPPYRRAVEDVEMLINDYGRVIYVTTPQPNNYWAAERQRWLITHMKAAQKDICLVKDKSLIRADALVDDNPANLETFGGKKYLMHRHYNREYDTKAHDMIRIHGLREVLLWESLMR